MAIVLVTPPALEPITVAEARLHLKEDTVDPLIDAQLQDAIQAVRELCENDCRRSFITQTWKLVLDAFPHPNQNVNSASWYGPQWGTSPGPLVSLPATDTTGYEIYLPRPPLIAVTSITYLDADSVLQTLDPATVEIDTTQEPGILLPAYLGNWPVTRNRSARVSITYTCGYGADPDLIPKCAKQWMLANLGSVYELRQAEMVVYRESLIVPGFVDRLLDPLRVRRY